MPGNAGGRRAAEIVADKKMTPPEGGVGWPVVQDGCYLAALRALRRSSICAGGT